MKKDEVKDKTRKQNDKKSKKVSHKIDSSSQIGKKESRMLSEILAHLLGCHQEFLLNGFGRWWSFGKINIGNSFSPSSVQYSIPTKKIIIISCNHLYGFSVYI